MKIRHPSFLIALFFASPAFAAEERDDLFGEWGTDAQCARELIIPSGSKIAEPIEVRAGWLRQGEMWCRLRWQFSMPDEAGYRGLATAFCGEDDFRAYRWSWLCLRTR